MKSGFLNILKPPGMTSHDVISHARRVIGEKRIGHAGTLDPAAAGVLPVAVGQAARLLEYLSITEKAYRAEILFGIETDSGDDTGKILRRAEGFSVPRERLMDVLSLLTGEIRQRPPALSAIKVDGRRAYKLAREGRAVELPERTVTISALSLVRLREASAVIDVTCSKGTYIRSLIASIGEALGIPVTMGFLLRTRVGDFTLESALTPEELAARGRDALLAPEPLLSHMARYALPGSRRKAFLNGLSTTDHEGRAAGTYAVYADGDFLGIGSLGAEGEIRPVKVFHQEEKSEL